ncbi:hypothetical protein ACFX58_19625, partial [Sphingomonas sp. NCPPB 2930]
TAVYLRSDPHNPNHRGGGSTLHRDFGARRDPITAGTALLVRYHYSAAGDLVAVDRRDGNDARRFGYAGHLLTGHSALGEPSSSSEPFAHRYRYEHDLPGARVLQQDNTAALGFGFDYEDAQNAVLVTDSLGRQERYRFQGTGGLKRLVSHTRADGTATTYAYDAAGRKIAETDPLGRVLGWMHDQQGRLLSLHHADSGITRQGWDAEGNLVSLTGPDGAHWRYAHDAWGRLVQATAPDGTRTAWRYPEIVQSRPGQPGQPVPLHPDRPIETTDAHGGTKTLGWTMAGQLAHYTDCSGRTTRYQYGPWGETLSVTDALDRSTHYDHDASGRLSRIVYPDGSQERYHYDARGAVASVAPQDAAGTATGPAVSIIRDEAGRITARVFGGASLRYAYDIAGRLQTLVNENGAETTFAYDPLDRLVREVGFDRRTLEHRYDAAGQLTSTVDAGVETRYRYDKAGRLTERLVPATERAPAHRLRYGYDAAGQLTEAADYLDTAAGSAAGTAAGTAATLLVTPYLRSKVAFERDRMGRITQEQLLVYPATPPEPFNPYLGPDTAFAHVLQHRYGAL